MSLKKLKNIGIDAYIISSDIYSRYLHENSIIAVPLEVNDVIEIGYLINRDRALSPLAQIYLKALMKYK